PSTARQPANASKVLKPARGTGTIGLEPSNNRRRVPRTSAGFSFSGRRRRSLGLPWGRKHGSTEERPAQARSPAIPSLLRLLQGVRGAHQPRRAALRPLHGARVWNRRVPPARRLLPGSRRADRGAVIPRSVGAALAAARDGLRCHPERGEGSRPSYGCFVMARIVIRVLPGP